MTVARLSIETLAPNKEVVELLESLLEQARAGKIRGVALLTNEPQLGQAGHSYAGEWSSPMILWAAETFKHRALHLWQTGLGA